MRRYDKEFKEESVKLTGEVGVKQASAQLRIKFLNIHFIYTKSDIEEIINIQPVCLWTLPH